MTSKAFGLAQLGNAYSDGALSNRNRIINGNFDIWQRGTSGTSGYIADRWRTLTNGSTAYSNSVSYTNTRAATAYSNAVSVASSDATSKAATAYSNAVSYTNTRASTAYSNAVSVASSDATSKAATAYSNAVSYASSVAATAYSNAVSAAAGLVNTSSVLNATAGMSVGGVGTYAYLLNNNYAGAVPGGTLTGTNLWYAPGPLGQVSLKPSGTWRCCGHVTSNEITLFVRIA